jgi:serpin B
MRVFLRLALVAPLIAGCSLDIGSIDELPGEFSITEQDLINTNNEFAFKIFRELVAQSDPDEDIFISPMSIAMALAMTYNGARGATRDSMQTVLELQRVDLQAVNEAYRSVIDLLRGLDPKVEFAIANSIWYREGLPVRQPFVDLNQTYFDAVVTALDFANSQAAPTINAWVSENTNGRIEEIVDDPIDPNIVMFLINAIYFKGDWTYQFDPDRTRTAVFSRTDGTESTIDLMNSGERIPIRMASDAAVQVGDLSYGGGAWRMTIVLPHQYDGLPTILDGIDVDQWTAWTENLDSVEIEVRLPKFTLEYEASLKDVLTALGMGIAFGSAADFSGIVPGGGLYISKVKHKTFLDVNEEGTEAAAATNVAIATSLRLFSVDRPFFFVIRETFSGSILFMGRIMDPAG